MGTSGGPVESRLSMSLQSMAAMLYNVSSHRGKIPDALIWPTFEAGYQANLVVDTIC